MAPIELTADEFVLEARYLYHTVPLDVRPRLQIDRTLAA